MIHLTTALLGVSVLLQSKMNDMVYLDKLASITKCDVKKMKQKRKVCVWVVVCGYVPGGWGWGGVWCGWVMCG